MGADLSDAQIDAQAAQLLNARQARTLLEIWTAHH